MSTTKYFFVRELVRLRRKITKLERALENHVLDDPQTAGQREILENEYNNRKLLMDLTAHASDPAELLMECRMRYMRVERTHMQANVRSASTGTHGQRNWWNTLGQMQYLSHLIHDMEQILNEVSESDLKRAMQVYARHDDISALLDKTSVLHAMAQADSTVTEKAFLNS
jgi:hypothetical protein